EGLRPALLVEMVCRNTQTTLSEYITTAIHLDNLLIQWSFAFLPCETPLRVMAVDNRPIGMGLITHQTSPLTLQNIIMRPCLATSIESPSTAESCHDSRVPSTTQGKERAMELPSYCPWDYAIDLLPNAILPKCKVYPLSLPKSKAKDDYVEKSLVASCIRPLTSSVAAGFFFTEKKDGSLRPCIDYRGLNEITVCYPYPPLLVPVALEQLREARIFMKLDLCSAYNLV
ncbi:hypothetical protein QTP70_034545, partial [Hemibagrus guttatus]